MRKTLEDFYYGNLTPGEQTTTPGSELHRAMVKVTQSERQLTELLNEGEQTILKELVSAQRIVESITALENFILGFRQGDLQKRAGKNPEGVQGEAEAGH